MKRRISVFALPAAAGAAFLVLATTAFAGTTQISGSFANGECGPTHSVPVGGPSRIEVSVSTTSASGLVYTQILDPAGNNASSSGSYDTPGAGNYGVRVCSYANGQDPAQMQYNGVIGTGPAGQPALPHYSGGVARVQASLPRSAKGHGAVRTLSGLAWITMRANDNGSARVRIDDAAMKLHLNLSSGMSAVFGTNSVRITGNGVTLIVVDYGSSQRVTVMSPRLKAKGTVGRGAFHVS